MRISRRAFGLLVSMVMVTALVGCGALGNTESTVSGPEEIASEQRDVLDLLMVDLEAIDGVTASYTAPAGRDGSNHYVVDVATTNDDSIYEALSDASNALSNSALDRTEVELSLHTKTVGTVMMAAARQQVRDSFDITNHELAHLLTRWRTLQRAAQIPIDLSIDYGYYDESLEPTFTLATYPNASAMQQLVELTSAEDEWATWKFPGLEFYQSGITIEPVNLLMELNKVLPPLEVTGGQLYQVSVTAADGASRTVYVELIDNTTDEFTSSPSLSKVQEVLEASHTDGQVSNLSVRINIDSVGGSSRVSCNQSGTCSLHGPVKIGIVQFGECTPNDLTRRVPADEELLQALTGEFTGALAAGWCI